MELEKNLGFRSSFNFVPRRYDVQVDLRNALTKDGFEVGVHGLYHDGRYYDSMVEFRKRAVEINSYLKEWGSIGFRSPSMIRNLDWIHELNIEYDASTFDTDPFEPQPHGVGTIFPFWVQQRSSQKGYVELPYTLPQDFTLFILMKEINIDIWKKKLDWIVLNGGMALIITHPDYMYFERKNLPVDQYPAEFYEEFLQYIRNKYGGMYWNVPPKDVTLFWKENFSNKHRVSKRVCMLTYSFYERDARVRRYAESLSDRGDEVDVISLRNKGAAKTAIIRGVNIYRIQERVLNEKGKVSYLIRLLRFFIKSAIFLTKEHLKESYNLIHVHNMPDFLVFATMVPKLMGAKVILDIHDILPEFYSNKFHSGTNSLGFKALILEEKASTTFSDHVIISNHLWEKKLLSRLLNAQKCTVMLNYPDSTFFYKRQKTDNKKKFIMIYPGTLNTHQGLDIAIRAFCLIKDQVPDVEFHIYGEGHAKFNLQDLVKELEMEDRVLFKSSVSLEEIAEIMGNADLGVVPKRNDAFGDEAFSTKIFQFMSLGVPVIVSETKIDRYYFNNSVVQFFKPEDENDLAREMLLLIKSREQRDRLATNALEFVEDYTWGRRGKEYFQLVDSLTKNSRK